MNREEDEREGFLRTVEMTGCQTGGRKEIIELIADKLPSETLEPKVMAAAATQEERQEQGVRRNNHPEGEFFLFPATRRDPPPLLSASPDRNMRSRAGRRSKSSDA